MSLTFQDFIDRYGLDSTTNFQLIHWAKELKIPKLKYVMRDELLDLKKTAKYIIMNLDSSEKKGHIMLQYVILQISNFIFLHMVIFLQRKSLNSLGMN